MSQCPVCKHNRKVGNVLDFINLFMVFVIGGFLGFFIGRDSAMYKVANGTHTVEVRPFSDGTREVRLVKIPKEPQ